MEIKTPIIAVIGRKNTGKTTLICKLIEKLTNLNYKVISFKHIGHKFTMDTPQTDTWLHAQAGANPVGYVSTEEFGVIYKNKFTIPEILSKVTLEADLILLEGFSSFVSDKEYVGKIICVKSEEELTEYKHANIREVICFCSYNMEYNNILNPDKDMEKIFDVILNWIKAHKSIVEILDKLPKLNCGKCGYRDCYSLAKAIKLGKKSFSDCKVIRIKKEVKASLNIDGNEVPLQFFVSEILRKTVLGMVSSLKNVEISGDESIKIEISKKRE
ncbi:MAG: molybdopterin-guanine dinucleotide biosynthesis protein B [Candidatus Odinarchaeia archaeon]